MVWSKSGKLYPKLLPEILNHDPRPTGLLALTSSDHAIILSTLMMMGIDVPRDLSYVGWAYSYTAALLPFPSITCLDDIFQSMAGAAVRRLLERTEDQTLQVESLVVPVKIRAGETCVERK
jgi:DNA-binding LacI/PurR family transcriptional regulator